LFGYVSGGEIGTQADSKVWQFFNRDQLITGSVLSCLVQDNRYIFYIPLLDTHPASSLISKFGILTAHVKGWVVSGAQAHYFKITLT